MPGSLKAGGECRRGSASAADTFDLSSLSCAFARRHLARYLCHPPPHGPPALRAPPPAATPAPAKPDRKGETESPEHQRAGALRHRWKPQPSKEGMPRSLTCGHRRWQWLGRQPGQRRSCRDRWPRPGRKPGPERRRSHWRSQRPVGGGERGGMAGGGWGAETRARQGGGACSKPVCTLPRHARGPCAQPSSSPTTSTVHRLFANSAAGICSTAKKLATHKATLVHTSPERRPG